MTSAWARPECDVRSQNALAAGTEQGLGFHADADAAGKHHLFRICFPHAIAFLFLFSYT